jgi:ferredoxin-NADP reductase
MAYVENFYFYPIKGFPGVELSEVDFYAGEGIRGDRGIGLGVNSQIIPGAETGSWFPCQNFHRMTIRPDLTTFKVSLCAEGVRLESPTGCTQVISEKTNEISTSTDVLDSMGAVCRAGENRGYWDHQDAAISIINLSTVEVIEKIVGSPIDPLRFRANIYVRCEPWSEFKWIGKRISIDGAQLDIIRPIDRCKTTSVNTQTGNLDLNMPAILMRYFGHMFCGIYATVHKSGSVTQKAEISIREDITSEQLKAAVNQKTAPDIQYWPRRASIKEIYQETEEIRSLWIQDSLESIGSLACYKAGQYVRIHSLCGDSVWRSYTVSAVKNGKIRITVKRDKGEGSQAIHQLGIDQNIILTGPFGDATLNDSSKAIHFISAGIGITPTAAKLTELAQQGYCHPVNVTHVARNNLELALWNDIVEAKDALKNASVQLYLTRESTGAADAFFERPNLKSVAHHVKTSEADVHICGPSGFVDSVVTNLREAGVDENTIFLDIFSSSDTPVEMRAIPESKPIKVTLAQTNITDYWNPEDGTLLDFSESRGATIPSHCRAGVCKTCRCKIIDGKAARLVGEVGNDSKQTLVCCSIPTESLTLDI